MTDLFHGSDPNPPFEHADLQQALQASKARAWRRRSVSVVPVAVLAGVGYIFAGALVGGSATTQVVTTFESAEVVLPANDGLVDIDGPVEVVSPSGPDAQASSAGGVTALQIDTERVTFIADKPTSLIDVEPESDVTPVTPPAEESNILETDSPDAAEDATGETSSATPLETASELSDESTADTAASSSDEPTDEPTSAPAQTQGPEGASAPGTDGVAPSAEDEPALEESPDPVPAAAGASDLDSSDAPDTTAGDPEETETDAASDAPVDTEDTEDGEVGEAAEALDGAESETPDAADAGDPADAETTDTGEAEANPEEAPAIPEEAPAVPAANMPVVVEFASMVIDGFSVEIVLQVNDPDGWSIGACGTSMNWGDGNSSGSLCSADCAVAGSGEAKGPGTSGEIRFTHTYDATEGVVTPLFTIFTGHECFGDAFYGELNPSLVLSPDGISFAS